MSNGKTVAVMQPYFFPYAGYYRLLAAVDEFVVFDCVQFPRRGRVHRTEVPGPGGQVEWLTLPVAAAPRETAIADLKFSEDARLRLDRRLARHPWVATSDGPAADAVRDHLGRPLGSVVPFLVDGIRLVAELLEIDVSIRRSSELDLPRDLRGQERVVAAVAATGGSRYVNAPGGRHLYDHGRFAAAGIELSFLDPYDGPHRHFLPALMRESLDELRVDLAGWICRG